MRIFVYGTLKRGLCNHRWMAGQQFIAEARTEPVYRMYDCGGFPGMIPVEQGGASILGEIWEVNEVGRRQLDLLEDVEGGEYALEPVSLATDDAVTDGAAHAVSVFTYIYKLSVQGLRDAGVDWKR